MSSNRPTVCGQYENSTDRYRTEWTRAPSVSMAVVEAVAHVEDVDPLEFGPLNDAIDPDALDSLFATPTSRDAGPVRELELHFGGCRVMVRGTGELVVQPVGPSASS